MIPKLVSCVHALRHGVTRAHILDGRIPHALLLEFFTREGIGDHGRESRQCSERRPGTTSCHALDREHVMQTYGRQPVAFVRGEGTRLWDSEGKEYLDFLAGLATVSLGHAHPAVTDALADQARDAAPRVEPVPERRPAAARGARSTCCSPRRPAPRAGCSSPTAGAEANECAIKLARRHGQANGGPERFHVLSAYNSFHGRTLTTLAATGQPQKQETFQPLPVGLPAGRLRRRRRAARRDRRARVRGPARAGAGGGRGAAGAGRLPRGGADAVRRAGGAAR